MRSPVRKSLRQSSQRLGGDLRASRVFLADEVSHTRWFNLGQFRWHDVALGRACRAAFGVITPLALGIATGHAEYGTYAALGALPAGFVSFRGITRTRVLAVLTAAAGMAVSTFVGATTAASAPWILVPVLMIWAYAVGVCAALGPTATAASLQWPLALLIASAVPLGPGPAAVRAGLVLAGGLWQGALVVSSWALSRGSAEQAAVGGSYRALSSYAAGLAAGQPGPPGPAPLPGADALGDPNPLLRSAARRHLMDLTEEAERIRATLTALGTFAPLRPADNGGRGPADNGGRGPADDGGRGPAEDGGRGPADDALQLPAGLGELLAASSAALAEIADALTSRSGRGQGKGGLAGKGGRAAEGGRAGEGRREESLQHARRLIAEISASPDAPWHWASEALRGQLRSACRIADRLNEAEPGSPGRDGPARIMQPGTTRDMALTLQASLGPASEAGRHALRLATVAAVAEVLIRAAGLSHGYWAVLTVFIVLRPDYSSTLQRGLQRAAGTVLGAGLGLATALLVHVGNGALLAGIAVSLVAAYALFTVSYLLYAVFLTDFVVVLLALLGLPPEPTALARLAGTGIGTGLAVLAYAVWPTWEGTTAKEKFARLLSAQGRFSAAALRAYARPDGDGMTRLRSLQVTARRARLEAEASADRLADEPSRPPMTGEFGQALASAGHQLAQAALTLYAVVVQHHELERDAARRDQADRVQAEHAQAEHAQAEHAQAEHAQAEHAQAEHAQAEHAQAEHVQAWLDQLADGVAQATGELAESLQRLAPPGPLPRLRELQAALPSAAGAAPGGLQDATDSLVDAVNTAADVVRAQLAPVSGPHS